MINCLDLFDSARSHSIHSYAFENCDALCDLVPFVQFKKREITHGGVLILVKLQAEAIILKFIVATAQIIKSNNLPCSKSFIMGVFYFCPPSTQDETVIFYQLNILTKIVIAEHCSAIWSIMKALIVDILMVLLDYKLSLSFYQFISKMWQMWSNFFKHFFYFLGICIY